MRIFALCFASLSLFVLAAPKKKLPPPLPRLAELPYSASGPIWSDVAALSGVFYINGGTEPIPATQATDIRMSWNEQYLWVHFHCHEDNMPGLISYHEDAAIWQNDCVEFFIDYEAQRRKSLQVICSVDGQKQVNLRGMQLAEGQIELKCQSFKQHWEAELRLPWSIFGQRPKLFRAALSRERRAAETEYSTWNWPAGFNNLQCHAYFFAGKQKQIIEEIRAYWQQQNEYHQVLTRQQPRAAKAWKLWLHEAGEVAALPYLPNSPRVVQLLDQLHHMEQTHPLNETVFAARIMDLLQKP